MRQNDPGAPGDPFDDAGDLETLDPEEFEAVAAAVIADDGHKRIGRQRWLVAAAVAGAVGLFASGVFVGSAIKPDGREAARPSATATTAPTVDSTTTKALEPVRHVMRGGRYLFRPLPDVPSLTITATGPDQWVGTPAWAMSGPEPVSADPPNGIGIAFLTADGVYPDPCHWDLLDNGQEGQPASVTVGPTVDDLVVALRANTHYTSSTPKPATIDGYTGKELELQLPPAPFAACDKPPEDATGHPFVFSGKAGLYAQGPANRWHLYVLDVRGTRLIAVVLSYKGTPQSDLDIARNIIKTLDIEA
jgi:hypothetical protein